MPLRHRARLLTILLAAIQFIAPAVIAVADGAFAKQVRDPGRHVESSGGEECSPPHSADCTVCRYLSGDGSDLSPATPSFISGLANVATAAADDFHGTALRGSTRSRAPPVTV